MLILPQLLLSRLIRKLTSPRLIRPVVVTTIDARGLHWFCTLRGDTLYMNTSPTAFTPASLMGAREVPLYALPVSQAAEISEAMGVYRDRLAAFGAVRMAGLVLVHDVAEA